jgi:hypothetical protein
VQQCFFAKGSVFNGYFYVCFIKFTACIFSEIAISIQTLRDKIYSSESVEGFSVETVARNGNCQKISVEVSRDFSLVGLHLRKYFVSIQLFTQV